MFEIEVTYKTGNSFGSHTETDLIGCAWEDLDEAKDAIKRIKEHNIFFNENNRFHNKRKKNKNPPNKDWHDVDAEHDDGEYTMFVVTGGRRVKISVFWRGYFEKLISAKITCEENDMEYIAL